MYLALFLTALLYCYVVKENKKPLFCYGLFGAVLVCFPLTNWILAKYFQGFYAGTAFLWLLPLWSVIAYTSVTVWAKQKDKWKKRLFFPAVCLILVLCGGLSGTYEKVTVAADTTEAEEVYKLLLEQKEPILLAAPRELMEEARRYDARILTVYGRDLWETDMDYAFYDGYEEWAYALAEHMEEPVKQNRPMLMDELLKSGAMQVVFDKENLTFDGDMQYPEQMKGNGIVLKQLAETRHYVVYVRAD